MGDTHNIRRHLVCERTRKTALVRSWKMKELFPGRSWLQGRTEIGRFGKMKLHVYRVLIFTLTGFGIATFLYAVIHGLTSSRVTCAELKGSYIVGVTSFGCASLLNAACGLQHKTMWGRNRMMTYEKRGVLYFVDLSAFVVGGVFMFFMAVKFWNLR